MEKDNVFTYEPKMKANLELIMDIMRCDCQEIVYKDKQFADLEKQLAESESELEKQKEKYDKLYGCYKKTSGEDLQDKYRLAEEKRETQTATYRKRNRFVISKK